MAKYDIKKVRKSIQIYNQKYPENNEILHFKFYMDLESLIELEIYLKQYRKEMNIRGRLGSTYD